MKMKRLMAGLLILLMMAGQMIPVYAGLDGTLSPVTIGSGSGGGSWDAIPKTDSLLRLSIIRQAKGTYKNFGFKDNYPDNYGRTMMLGGTGNNKTTNVGYFQGGEFGYINASNTIFFNNNWLGNNAKNIGSMFQEAKASSSNSNKLRFYKTGVKIPLNQVNGLYVFEPIDQFMVYGAAQVLVGENSGSVPENVSGHYEGGCAILVDYVDYLSTGAPHSLADVDYPGPNCLILHDPVSAQDIFVYDIPDSTLQDQRIGKDSFTITRSFIDYAFKLTIPNTGSFEYNEARTKRADLLEHSLLKIHRKPGVLCKSYAGKYNTAFNTLPRGTA